MTPTGIVFQLRRRHLTNTYTLGVLLEPDGTRICDILEDPDRDLNENGLLEEGKVWGDTAIPYGLYPIVLNKSPKFGRIMPYIEGIKTHTGVMFHSGVTTEHTHGCPLTGTLRGHTLVNGRLAFQDLMDIIARYIADGDQLFVQVVKADDCIDERTFGEEKA